MIDGKYEMGDTNYIWKMFFIHAVVDRTTHCAPFFLPGYLKATLQIELAIPIHTHEAKM